MVKRKRRQTPLTTVPPIITPATLPDELLNIIVRIACCHSPKDESEPPTIDVKTMHSFALVSKPLYNLVTPFLYAHVRLTKPSDLLLYARTLLIQPSLAAYTKTLWIGPDESHAEVQDSWPLNKDCTAIKSSITEPMRLPHGVKVGTWWFFAAEGSEATSGMATEVNAIIQEACKTLGLIVLSGRVSLNGGREPSFDGTGHGQSEGRLKIYEVQQRLDAFLYAARRREDSYKPPEYSTSTPLRMYDAFDRFDHPMVHERSKEDRWNFFEPWECFKRGVAFEDMEFGIKTIDADDDFAPEQPQQSEEIEYSRYSFGSDEHLCSNNSLESSQDQCSNNSPESDQDDSSDDSLEGAQDECSNDALLFIFSEATGRLLLDLSKVVGDEVLSGKPTLGILIFLSRIVLERSHNVLSLALTSYLQTALCGSDHGPDLDRLYSLTVGPPARQYQRPLRLTHKGLNNVRRLRIWESAPSAPVFSVMEHPTALPALESLECTWSAPWENSFDKELEGEVRFETDAASASLSLLLYSDLRVKPRKNPLQVTVWAHRNRISRSDPSDLESVMDVPQLKLEALPWAVTESQGYQQRQRPQAFARVRARWEKECQEVLALHPEEPGSFDSVPE